MSGIPSTLSQHSNLHGDIVRSGVLLDNEFETRRENGPSDQIMSSQNDYLFIDADQILHPNELVIQHQQDLFTRAKHNQPHLIRRQHSQTQVKSTLQTSSTRGFIIERPLFKIKGDKVLEYIENYSVSMIGSYCALLLDAIWAIYIHRSTDIIRAGPISSVQLGRFFMVAAPLWTSWYTSVVEHDYYFNRDDIVNIVYTGVRIVLGLGMAWTAPGAFTGANSNWTVYFVHLIALRLFHFSVQVAFAIKNSRYATHLLLMALTTVLQCIPLAISFFVDTAMARNAVWVTYLVLDLAAPFLVYLMGASFHIPFLPDIPFKIIRHRFRQLGTFLVAFKVVYVFHQRVGVPDGFGISNFEMIPYICGICGLIIYLYLERMSCHSTLKQPRLEKIKDIETMNSLPDVSPSLQWYDRESRLLQVLWRWCHIPFHLALCLLCTVLSMLIQHIVLAALYKSMSFLQSSPSQPVPFWNSIAVNRVSTNDVFSGLGNVAQQVNSSQLLNILSRRYQELQFNDNPITGTSSSLLPSNLTWSPPLYFCTLYASTLLFSMLLLGFSGFLDRTMGGTLFWMKMGGRLVLVVLGVILSSAQVTDAVVLVVVALCSAIMWIVEDAIFIVLRKRMPN